MTVKNVNALFAAGAVQAANQTGQAARQDESASASFGQVMSKVNGSITNLKSELAGAAAAVSQAGTAVNTVQTEQAGQTVQGAEKQPASDAGKTEDTMQQDNSGKVVQDAETQEAVEATEESAEQLVQDIAEEMGVTPEEVEEAMAILGLTAVELFDVDNLKQLLLQISGSTDELALVTDAGLYNHLQNLVALADESLGNLQEELGMSEEEMDALLEQIVAKGSETDVQDVGVVQDNLEMPEAPEESLEGMKDYTVSVQKNGETVQVKVTVDDQSGSKSVTEEVTDAPKEEVQVSGKAQEKNSSADTGKGEGHATGNAFLQMPDKPAEVSEAPAPVNESYQSAQTQEIMDQIMEYMKINLKAESQHMEMQLHPASLGTVNVQIAAKDGAITAQFTTQNETVRAVIETQLIQLKNQFEEQGIKVDAVEVTVANHEYGQQQFSQEQADAKRQQGKASKGMRRINLDELEGEEELAPMEESERIAVEMMQANGNTVDYTA